MWTSFAAVVLLAAVTFQFKSAEAITLEEGPQSQIFAQVGETVIFSCDFRDVGERTVYWYYREARLYLSNNRVIYRRVPDALKSRLSVIGDVNLEQFNLRLADVRVSDSGIYFCQYAFKGGLATNAGSSNLTVFSPPSPQSPVCSVESGAVTYEVGDTVLLKCEAVAGNPPPQVAYRRAISDEVLVGPTASYIAFQYQLRAEDNGMDFICAMTTPALKEARQCSVQPLRILPTALVTPSSSAVLQGDGTSLFCDGYGEPSIGYGWYIQNTNTGGNLPQDRYMVSDDRTSVVIPDIQEDITVICVVTTPNGLAANSTALVILNEQASTMLSTTKEQTTFSDIVSTDTNSTVPTELNATQQSTAGSELSTTRQPITSPAEAPIPITLIIATISATLVLFFAITIVILCCMCRRRNKRSIPREDYPMTERGNTYEEIPIKPHKEQSSNLEAQTSAGQSTNLHLSSPASTPSANPVYASPNKPRRGVPQTADADLFFPKSYVPLYATPNRIRKPATDNKSIPTDGLYAQPTPRSKKKLLSTVLWGLDKNGYSIVKRDDVGEPDSGVVYADLEMKAGASGSSKDLAASPVKEQTVYAQILS